MSTGFRDDNYLSCSDYRGHAANANGFSLFQYSNGQFYFALIESDGSVILRSEGYSSELGRENGINSVLANMNDEDQYSTKQLEDGRWVLCLKAKNHQEIARSCPCNSEADANSFRPSERKKQAEARKEMESDDYLICQLYKDQITSVSKDNPDFIKFTHSNGEFYFALIDGDEVLLRSEGYKTEVARDNGIESVIKNKELEERYSIVSPHGIYFTVLKAGNHQEIARSCPYKTEEEAKAIFPSERSKRKVSSRVSTKESVDDYLICGEYKEQIANKSEKYPEFISFTHQNGEHYFAMIDGDDILLRSEGYKSESARDNGIESVIKNKEIEERYSIVSAHGIYFTVLKAGNHQEIARSCPYKNEDEAKSIFPSERAKRKTTNSSIAKEREDDYLICKEYREQIAKLSDKYPGFISFTHQNGEHYFAMVEGDRILLRSEAYKSESARDNGIESVIRNRDIEERYSIETAHGIYFTVLKAGNSQEIARSCPQKSNDDALSIFPSKRSALLAAAATAAAPIISQLTSEATKISILDSPAKTETIAEPVKTETTPVASNLTNQEKVAPTIQTPPPSTPKKKEVDDNYLHCKEYQGHPIVDKMNRVAFFRHAGEFYFAIYKEDGSVRLRSEGFTSVESRDKELSIALRHLNTPERYTIIRNGDMYIKILKDVDAREVGRSCLEKDEVKLTPPSPVVEKSSIPLKEVATAATVIASASALTKDSKKDKEDDYLECKHYMGHAISDKENKVAFFQHEGQYYFVIYYADGRVRLRSEGFQKTSQRDSELKAALRHLDDKGQYEVVKKGDYILRILKDKTGREVGRSCLEKEYITPVAPIAPIVPVATTAASVINEAAPIAAASSGGSNWWKWLLPLLLLAGLLFFLKDCKGCKSDVATVPPAKIQIDTPKIAVTPTVVDTTPPTPSALVCNCDVMTHPVFNLAGKSNPKILHRLGTNPEFGSLHGLSSIQVLERMSSVAKKNSNSKKFLDGVFKQLGYSGFEDIKSSMMTEVDLPRGIIGNIGYSKEHKTLYAQLDNEPHDLMAFKFTGKNGCDIHFMKTCGNHFFFCPN